MEASVCRAPQSTSGPMLGFLESGGQKEARPSIHASSAGICASIKRVVTICPTSQRPKTRFHKYGCAIALRLRRLRRQWESL